MKQVFIFSSVKHCNYLKHPAVREIQQAYSVLLEKDTRTPSHGRSIAEPLCYRCDRGMVAVHTP